MKKSLIMLLIAAICMPVCAYADNSAETGNVIEIGKDVTFDLVGSGTPQTIRAQYKGLDDDRVLEIVVFGSDGGVNLYDTEIKTLGECRIEDVDDDGLWEILVSGSVYAMDDMTYCLRFTDEAGITAMPFADIDRGGEKTGYADSGYGALTSAEGEPIVLKGYQDVLGTYSGSRTFAPVDGKMELSDDGLWRFEVNDETWKTKALTLTRALKVTMDNGKNAKLSAGEQIVVTASDLVSVVYFTASDGRSGSFAIEPDTERGFGSLINGVSEDDCFEDLPYAG